MPAAISFLHLRRAAQAIDEGGVIAYPTEGVFGLGCDPGDFTAVERICTLKRRGASTGLILLAADRTQLDDWIEPSPEEDRALTGTQAFVTWIVTAAPDCPAWITGGRATCAVRITRHPVAVALCLAVGQPIVSTSANRHGHPAARSALGVRRLFGDRVDYIMPGATGRAPGPSPIRDARSGSLLRAG